LDVGSEAYSSARIFYHHVKNAARGNIPGASAIAKELSKRFKIAKPTTPSSDDQTPNAPENQETKETG